VKATASAVSPTELKQSKKGAFTTSLRRRLLELNPSILFASGLRVRKKPLSNFINANKV
jgi:hypothetical protein